MVQAPVPSGPSQPHPPPPAGGWSRAKPGPEPPLRPCLTQCRAWHSGPSINIYGPVLCWPEGWGRRLSEALSKISGRGMSALPGMGSWPGGGGGTGENQPGPAWRGSGARLRSAGPFPGLPQAQPTLRGTHRPASGRPGGPVGLGAPPSGLGSQSKVLAVLTLPRDLPPSLRPPSGSQLA